MANIYERLLSTIIPQGKNYYLTLFSIFVSVSSVAWATINCGSASPLSPRAVLPLVVP